MNQQPLGTTDDAAATDTKAKWVRPNVERLIAGGAESGGSTTTDGVDVFS